MAVGRTVIKALQSLLGALRKWNLNFFRIHLLWFTINPLIWSVIFYLCNGQFHISYIDSLFICVSAQTATGLSPINVSTLTGFQQAILFYLIVVGNYTITSFVMVLVRKHYFVEKVLKSKARPDPVTTRLANLSSTVRSKTIAAFENTSAMLPFRSQSIRPLRQQDIIANTDDTPEDERGREPSIYPPHEVRWDSPRHQTHAMNDLPNEAAKKVTPTTQPSPGESDHAPTRPATPGPEHVNPIEAMYSSSVVHSSMSPRQILQGEWEPIDPNRAPSSQSHTSQTLPLGQNATPSQYPNGEDNTTYQPTGPSPLGIYEDRILTRTATRMMTPGPSRQGTGLFFSPNLANSNGGRTLSYGDRKNQRLPTGIPVTHAQTAPYRATAAQTLSAGVDGAPTYERGFGGFPTPLTLTGRLARQIAPNAVEKLKRSLTLNEPQVYVPEATARSRKDPEADAGGRSTSRATGISHPNSSVRPRRLHPHFDSNIQGANLSSDHSMGWLTQHTVHGGFSRKLTKEPTLAPPHLQSAHDSATQVPPHLRFAARKRRRNPSPQGSDVSSNDIFDEIQEGVMKTVAFMTHGVLRVGRNSAFDTEGLSQEQIEELGGVEYRALCILSWIVGLYFVGVQLSCFIILTWFLRSTTEYDPVFAGQPRQVPKAWFAAFQAASAYTGTGLSLVDAGMVPFQGAYVLIVFQGMCIIAGNMGLAILLRLIVWILFKFAPVRHREPLGFLLQHPRRCFLYLFPSHQTWFLVVVFLMLTIIEWSGFLILDIGLEVVESIPLGRRFLAGLFQSIAVRASGFAIVPLGSIAPAVKFLYLVMMYISAYPIAMSIRSTNVYEQRSLGIYEDIIHEPGSLDPDAHENTAKLAKGGKGEVLFSKYLSMHVRRQLSFDLWWLAAAVFLICIIERTQIMNPENESWFNQFQIMFELVSAYGTIGLSLGIPTENYSFSGALQPLSKLIFCLVMIRGRHRDLPQAIDRAILLPHEFAQSKVDSEGRHIVDGVPPGETNADVVPGAVEVPESGRPGGK